VITSATRTKTVEYKYNSDGIRVASIEEVVENRYLIDENRDYAQVLEEFKPDGTANVSYVYGWDLISENRFWVKSFYLVDSLGSTIASKVVRSSHAISIMRSIVSGVKFKDILA